TRDGIYTDIESRWSCATRLVPDKGPCQIEFTFAEPQNIVEIQVAFWKGDERTRTLGVRSVTNCELNMKGDKTNQPQRAHPVILLSMLSSICAAVSPGFRILS
ncbi:unnamed protein product, partial [Ectocarpus sp. 12 AP-2014]